MNGMRFVLKQDVVGVYCTLGILVFRICVEKNSELAEHLRKFKGCVVFQGNQVYDQNYNYAIFQDLGSSPATLQAAKTVDFFAGWPYHAIKIADAEQAYIQADMKGDPTWVCLRPESAPGMVA